MVMLLEIQCVLVASLRYRSIECMSFLKKANQMAHLLRAILWATKTTFSSSLRWLISSICVFKTHFANHSRFVTEYVLNTIEKCTIFYEQLKRNFMQRWIPCVTSHARTQNSSIRKNVSIENDIENENDRLSHDKWVWQRYSCFFIFGLPWITSFKIETFWYDLKLSWME